jgi:hypothetical protein
MPALAHLLASAEKKKGAPLTRAEVESLRDGAPCKMMKPADAEQMTASRGFVDVNPENAWADWHRLRPQLVGGYLPMIVLCIPGDADFPARCAPILNAANVQHEFRPRDPRLRRAFQASSIAWPCFTPEEFQRIDDHATVLYILSPNFTPADAPKTARTFLSLGRQLLDAGGLAIKCESSGIAHSHDRWSKLDDATRLTPGDDWNALFLAYVVHPVGTDQELYTCGLHLLGLPDLVAATSVLTNATKPNESTTAAAVRLFRTFALYLLAECPIGQFASGHTFSPDRTAPRHRLLWEPCTTYAEDSLFHNPFGRWRFTTI